MGGGRGLHADSPDDWNDAAKVADPSFRSVLRYWTGVYSLVLPARASDAIPAGAEKVLRALDRSSTNSVSHCSQPHVEWSLAAAELGLRHFARCAARLLQTGAVTPAYSKEILHGWQLNVTSPYEEPALCSRQRRAPRSARNHGGRASRTLRFKASDVRGVLSVLALSLRPSARRPSTSISDDGWHTPSLRHGLLGHAASSAVENAALAVRTLDRGTEV